MNRAKAISNFLSTPWSPRFSLRALLWAVAFVAGNCSLISVITSQASAHVLSIAFAVNLVLICAFLITEARSHKTRAVSLFTAASAVVAIGCVFYMRGLTVKKVLVNDRKFATDLEVFATSPLGCMLTVVGIILFASIAAASLQLLFSPRLKVGFLALIWMSVWLMLFDIAKETQPFVDPTPHIPASRLFFVE